jgi:cytidine deaminase
MSNSRFDYGSYEQTFDEPFDPWQQFLKMTPRMVRSARQASLEAFSYRNFHVGASLLAINPHKKRMGMYSAGNLKIDPSTEKFCAEASVIKKARHDGMTRAIGLVVVGTLDPDMIRGVTGKVTPTLHPCDSCRNLFVDSALIQSDTIVVTTGDTLDAHQVHSVGQLIKFYQNDTDEAADDHYQSVGDQAPNSWRAREQLYVKMSELLITESRAEAALFAAQAVYL